MSSRRTGLIALFIAIAAVSPALAERGRGRDDRSFAGFEISRATAVDSARAQGMREVRQVEARNGMWKIRGTDGRGNEMHVDVDGFTGAVVKVEKRQ